MLCLGPFGVRISGRAALLSGLTIRPHSTPMQGRLIGGSGITRSNVRTFTAHGPTNMTRQFTVNQNGSFLSIPVVPTVKPLSNSNAVTGQAPGVLRGST